MSDAELLAKLETVTRERDALLGQLAARRKNEEAALAGLEARVNAAEKIITRREGQLARDAETMKAAEHRRERLKDGLSPLGRLWARWGEPLTLCVLVLVGFLSLAISLWAKPVALTLSSALAIGGGLRWWMRGPHG